MKYAVKWFARGEMFSSKHETIKDARILQNFLLKEGFCSEISEVPK